jgi:transcription elongation factor Elf1
MSEDDVGEYTFTCPVCEETLLVNESMRETLIERGCVICRTPISAAAFTTDDSNESA